MSLPPQTLTLSREGGPPTAILSFIGGQRYVGTWPRIGGKINAFCLGSSSSTNDDGGKILGLIIY